LGRRQAQLIALHAGLENLAQIVYFSQNSQSGLPMKTMTAAQAKNAFGQMLDTAQREPVMITKQNRPVGVFLSMQDLEDTIWGEQALRAHAEGYVGEEASHKLLDRLLNAKD